MLDIINIPLIGIKNSSRHHRPAGWGGILLLGAVSGLVAAPCSTPVLGSILTMVSANTQSALFAGALLFVYGLGLGTLLIAAGTFSGLAASLPKSGRWMDIVKKIFGVTIILTGFYFLIVKGFLLF
ncbi:MAG: cytochrome c biogenesis protein CcdA [Elusimicrobiota bacterium]|nr:cytochrome c biogenesis protein CcdA [Elusimicrobiota bacterium]